MEIQIGHNKINLGNSIIYFKVGGEILGMGGPWNGDLYQDDFLISADVLLDVMAYDADNGIIYFAKFNKFKTWFSSNYFFTVNFFVLTTKKVYQYKHEFRRLFLGKLLSDNVLEIYDSFHDGFPEKKSLFNLNEEAYVLKT